MTTTKACAKINLTLEVLGRRPNGFHEIMSVMQAISLSDLLTFDPHHDIQLACDIAELASPHNLVYRAARLMKALAESDRGVSISLSKGIPLAGGLGGGSSDAAVTLQVLNNMWGINLPGRRLAKVASQLGSDVSFFVGGSPTALVSGRGEEVESLPSLAKTWVVLLRPPLEMPHKTREMYAHLNPSCFTKGEHAQRLANSVRAGKRVTNEACFNVFDPLARSVFPGLDRYRREFLAAGASKVHLAGSGPTLFSLVSVRGEGEEILRRLRKQRMEVYLAETI